MLRNFIWSVLGDKLRGKLDYSRFPELRNTWGGPFNGQLFRQDIFKELVQSIKFDCVVETGTYRGTTTEYMAQTVDLPIFTVEAVDRNFGFSSQRLRSYKNVQIECCDSRIFLEKLAVEKQLNSKTTLFYLDAHWREDLPLAEELNLIFKHWNKAVILIDDFQVPDDPGYGYDNYGIGKALTLDYLNIYKSQNYRVFFPSISSEQETGKKRGMVVLSNNVTFIEQLRKLETLREYQHTA